MKEGIALLISEAATLASQLDTEFRQGAPALELKQLSTDLLVKTGTIHAALTNAVNLTAAPAA